MEIWYTLVCIDDWCIIPMLFGYHHIKREGLWISLNSWVIGGVRGWELSQSWT